MAPSLSRSDRRRPALLPCPWLAGRLALAVSLLSLVGTIDARADGPQSVDFGRDILPILSDKCFPCHGPDAETRKADLRLDLEESLLRKKDPVVAPGHSEESELIFRLLSDDPMEKMPPPESNLTLTGSQVDLLKRWVDEGARWSGHWAFIAPRRPELPRVARSDWAINPIDRFVLADLERLGMAPSPEASREVLIRRATLDLTGLPPTVEEIDAFLADQAPGSFERVVDRLLASPRYGERMTTDWLDLARYADTHGYQSDRERPVWPWRDWVISSFNRNQRFDEFVTWQLAGDLLPRPTKEQRLATSFNRLHMQNEEGGIVEEEFRVTYVVDRVNTAGTAFLGLTFECTRCHDHKFDPLTQRDYYSLFSMFQNIDESGQTSYFTRSTPVPAMLLSDEATDAKLEDLERRIESKEEEIRRLRDGELAAFERWLSDRGAEPPPTTGLVGSFAFESIDDGKTANAVKDDQPAKAVESPTMVEGKSGQAAQLSGEDGFTFPKLGHFSRADPFSIGIWIKSPAHTPRAVVYHHSKAPIDAGSRGYELVLEDGKVAFGLHHMWPGNSLKVVTRTPIPTGEWAHVAVTYDGSSRAVGVRIFVDGESMPLDVVRDKLVKDITYEGGEPDLAIGHRFRDNGFKGGQVDDFRVFDRELSPIEVADLAGRPDLRQDWAVVPADLTSSQRDRLLAYYLANVSAGARQGIAELHTLRQEYSQLINPIPEAMVMKEMATPRPAFILKRGAYDSPGEPVSPGTPAVLPPMFPDLPRNRLGLARWLFQPDHPLTARVGVNRFWQMMFGRGIVETSENFGRQGARPTHPELLDWLAREFVDSGWDVKWMVRLIATSATYRQSSKTDPALLARDPANTLLARGPAFRLTAEMIRDQALAAGGLLVEKIGGPPVKPYQPDGLWAVASSGGYETSKGPDLYRRSLYTFWKRTVPHPSMVIFDAADRNNCAMRRQSTSTPLQALALLNDPQLVEAARNLAQLAMKEGGGDNGSRASWMFRRVLGRSPSPREALVLAGLVDEQRSIFEGDRESAGKLLSVGDSKPDPALNPVDLAAVTVLAEAILNHDGAVNRR
ncbi:DUF1553 domain-containing protein [Tundrisphaera lichenicola]|uniref:DUF1553 domain-containing protein n=1 Tax=Tundrisphaera lichenicola TaxID=2029860 RepID=UPI003EBD938D